MRDIIKYHNYEIVKGEIKLYDINYELIESLDLYDIVNLGLEYYEKLDKENKIKRIYTMED